MDLTNEIEFACIEKVALERATVTGPWAWDVRVNQLSSGSFRSKLQIIRSADLMIYEQQWQRSVEVIGTTSKFCVMIGTNLAWKRTTLEWCGKNLDNQQFACAAPGSEVDFKSPGGSHHVVMQVKPDVLVNTLKGNAMKIEIWSDVACPYCYIGKRHFERALESLPGRKNVEIEWKSFELNPDAQKQYEEDNYTRLANKYGQTREWALQAANQMKAQGKGVGLAFDFDSLITTNTFDAHRLTHLAKGHGLQNEAEEALFEAYLVNGENVSDHATLLKIGGRIGLEDKDIRKLLDSDQFAREVREDEMLGQQFGIQGVPYFVVNRKHAISGAQPIEHFVEVLKSVELDGSGDAVVQDENGNSCDMDGCD